jgi:hypothetical protein
MPVDPQIELLKGFSGLAFGSTPEQALALFGQPEETGALSDDILQTHATVYYYWEQGYTLFFDALNGNRFNSVEIDNPATLLAGSPLFTLREKELTAFMKEQGYPLSDSETHPWGEKRLSFDEAGLDCYFERGKLISLNFGIPG